MLMLYLVILTAFYVPGVYIPGLATVWPTDIMLLFIFIWRFISPPRMTLEYRAYMQKTLMLPLYLFAVWLFLITLLTMSATPEVSPGFILFSMLGRFRPILFILFIIPYCSDSRKIEKMFKFLILIFVLQFIVLILQRNNVADINYWYTPRFRPAEAELSAAHLSGRRTIGTIGNPNSVGSFMSICAVLGFSMYSFGAGWRRWIGLSMTIIAFVSCVFLAGTRQGTLMIVSGCLLLAMIALFLGKIGRLAFSIILILLSTPVFLFYLAKNYSLFQRFAVIRGASGILKEGSMQARLQLWPEFLDVYGVWAYIGKGMGGYMTAITWDSGWLMLLVGGGIPLAMIYLWWLLRVGNACFKALPYRSGNTLYLGLLLTGPATSFIVILTNIVNNTYGDTKVAVLIGLVYVLSLSAVYHIQYSGYYWHQENPASFDLDYIDNYSPQYHPS